MRTSWAMCKAGVPLLLTACLLSSGCRDKPLAEHLWMTMGTVATLTVPPDEATVLEATVGVVTGRVAELEKTLSLFNPDSDVSRLNAAAGGEPIRVASPTRDNIFLSLKYAELSGGCFDPTIAPLVRLWGFNKGATPPEPPEPETLQAALRRVGYRHITLRDEPNGPTAALRLAGMEIDLGGIAKGYAVDICFDELVRRRVPNVMINIGGNLRVRGVARGGRPWRIGVRDPFDGDRLLGAILMPDGMALATSGNYERFITIAGRRYAHIIDPRTGRPVEGMAGVTVLCRSAAEADAMSTALFVLGVRDALAVISRVPGCHALFVPDAQPIEILITPGFRRYFTPDPSVAGLVRELTDGSGLPPGSGRF